MIKLAGVAGGSALYHEECEAIAAAGFRVACVDTSGDRGDDPASGPITWDGLAAEVRGAIDALGAERAILWGTSYGSLVALATAARHPSRVSGLVLAVPPEPSAQPPWFPKVFAWAARSPRPDFAVRALIPIVFAVYSSWELKHRDLRSRILPLARLSREAATPSRTVREKLYLLWHESPGLPPPGLWPRTSLIAAQRDRIAPHAGARKLAVRMTGSRLVTLEVGGHGVAWSHTDAYHMAVIQELRTISKSP